VIDQLNGMAFPFRITGRRATPNGVWVGGIDRASGSQKIEQDLIQLLSVRLGERVMLRGYGGGVHRQLQQPNDSTLRTVIRHDIEVALRQFLPEVQLTSPIRVDGRDEQVAVVVEYAARPGVAEEYSSISVKLLSGSAITSSRQKSEPPSTAFAIRT